MSDEAQRRLLTLLVVVLTAVLSRPLRSMVDEAIPERRGVGDDLAEAVLQGVTRVGGYRVEYATIPRTNSWSTWAAMWSRSRCAATRSHSLSPSSASRRCPQPHIKAIIPLYPFLLLRVPGTRSSPEPGSYPPRNHRSSALWTECSVVVWASGPTTSVPGHTPQGAACVHLSSHFPRRSRDRMLESVVSGYRRRGDANTQRERTWSASRSTKTWSRGAWREGGSLPLRHAAWSFGGVIPAVRFVGVCKGWG
jgi:hypothetical protein